MKNDLNKWQFSLKDKQKVVEIYRVIASSPLQLALKDNIEAQKQLDVAIRESYAKGYYKLYRIFFWAMLLVIFLNLLSLIIFS